MRHNKLKILGIVAIIIIVSIVGFKIFENRNINKAEKKDYIIYDADKAIKKALEKLANSDKKANIIGDVSTSKKVIALNFVGLSTPETNDKVLDMFLS